MAGPKIGGEGSGDDLYKRFTGVSEESWQRIAAETRAAEADQRQRNRELVDMWTEHFQSVFPNELHKVQAALAEAVALENAYRAVCAQEFASLEAKGLPKKKFAQEGRSLFRKQFGKRYKQHLVAILSAGEAAGRNTDA